MVRASGHLENFTDPEVTCSHCHATFRADSVLEKVRPDGIDGLSPTEIGELIAEHHVRCPSCGTPALSIPRPFNLMFGLDLGVTGKERGYLRPETAQSSYLAFSRMWDVGRRALPLGIAVIGKAFRNEIAPRQVLFRTRSFTQAELQIFFDPDDFPVPIASMADRELPMLRVPQRENGSEEPEWVRVPDLVAAGGLPPFYVYHLAQLFRFLVDVLGYPPKDVRFFEKSDPERAFYNRIQFDAEVRIASLGGFREIGAVHYRGDYDLTRDSQGSGKDLSVTRDGGKRLVPHVLEITFGVDRNLWALADLGLRSVEDRNLWSIPGYLAPIPVAVLPLDPEGARRGRSIDLAAVRGPRDPGGVRPGEQHREALCADGRGRDAVLHHGRRGDHRPGLCEPRDGHPEGAGHSFAGTPYDRRGHRARRLRPSSPDTGTGGVAPAPDRPFRKNALIGPAYIALLRTWPHQRTPPRGPAPGPGRNIASPGGGAKGTRTSPSCGSSPLGTSGARRRNQTRAARVRTRIEKLRHQGTLLREKAQKVLTQIPEIEQEIAQLDRQIKSATDRSPGVSVGSDVTSLHLRNRKLQQKVVDYQHRSRTLEHRAAQKAQKAAELKIKADRYDEQSKIELQEAQNYLRRADRLQLATEAEFGGRPSTAPEADVAPEPPTGPA